MTGLMSEYELEALPELGENGGHRRRCPKKPDRRPTNVIIGTFIDRGYRNPTKIADEVFWLRNPSWCGKKIPKRKPGKHFQFQKQEAEWNGLFAEAVLMLKIMGLKKEDEEWGSYQDEGNRNLKFGSRESESEQFFEAIDSVASRRETWSGASGSPQRQMALAIARQALAQGMESEAASGLELSPQGECECEFELNPMRKIYPDAMLEHLGHAAAETQSEAQAEALAGAMVPLAARIVPRAAPIIVRATPGLVRGVSGIVRHLRNEPRLRPLVRVVPLIVRDTAVRLAQQSARGMPVTPQTALRALAGQTVRILGCPRRSALAFRRSQALDRQLHRHPGSHLRICPACGKIR